MRGRKEVVQELIRAKPESLKFRHQGKTVVHLCVMYNHLETLKALVELESTITGQLLNFTSYHDAGNTLLSFAIRLERVEVVNYLLSIPQIREIADLRREIEFTVHDTLERSPNDFKICKIQHMLIKAENEGFQADNPQSHPPPPSLPSMNIFKHIPNGFRNWLMGEGDDWLKEMRGNLSLVSTVIATITFQALINPPGGFIQQGLLSGENTTSSNGVLNCTVLSGNQTYCPGQAISSFPDHKDFEQHVYHPLFPCTCIHYCHQYYSPVSYYGEEINFNHDECSVS
ncbi:uncharacterized protein LOC129287698 [Prosopis cineraria]|uniref:uncharacterized protein LOC129287698 n=1 Tax=Prosopis cineraria TaxID=364024 RepID=UPI00241018DD|nr:uncharacterized protein LOC129287698 [Prosopis cineraria]